MNHGRECRSCSFINHDDLVECEVCGDRLGRVAPPAMVDLTGSGIEDLTHISDFPKLTHTQSEEIADYAGLSRTEGRSALTEAGGDIDFAKEIILRKIGILDFDANDSRAEKLTDCPICFDRPTLNQIHLECYHAFCRSCLSQHVQNRMDEGDTGAIACPLSGVSTSLTSSSSSGCGHVLTQRELRRVLGTAAYAVLDRRALESAVVGDHNLHFCPTPDCSYIIYWAGPEDGGMPDLPP